MLFRILPYLLLRDFQRISSQGLACRVLSSFRLLCRLLYGNDCQIYNFYILISILAYIFMLILNLTLGVKELNKMIIFIFQNN